MKADPSSRFHTVYCGLPLTERSQPIVVIGKEPISWKLARMHISKGDKIGKQILKQLVEMEII